MHSEIYFIQDGVIKLQIHLNDPTNKVYSETCRSIDSGAV